MTTDLELFDAYPSEVVDHDTKYLFRGFLAHRLVLNRCRTCGRWHHPPAACCPDCWSFDVDHQAVSGSGHVYFSIRLHQGPDVPGVDYTTPYPVVTVGLVEQEGLRFTAPLVEHDGIDLPIGTLVSLTWIDRGGSPYPAFRPGPGPR